MAQLIKLPTSQTKVTQCCPPIRLVDSRCFVVGFPAKHPSKSVCGASFFVHRKLTPSLIISHVQRFTLKALQGQHGSFLAA